MIISCEASSTFQATSFQNEHFVRGFLNFSLQLVSKTSISCEASSTLQANKLPKGAFRARLPQLFNRRSFQNEHFVRGFLNFSIKELPKSCACHAKPENDLSPWKFEASKRAFRARLPSNSTLSTWKSTISCSKSMTFAKLPPLFKTLTKCCACHDIWKSVTFARPCQCDLWKQHLRHITKCCPCHDIAKGHITKCCACHAKTTRLHCVASKVLCLSRKTRKWSHILWLGSAKTSISCETCSTFHTLKVRIGSQCECTAQWQRINDATTTTRRRDDDETTTRRRRDDDETTTRRRRDSKTTRTQLQPQTPTINGNPSLRIREKGVEGFYHGSTTENHFIWDIHLAKIPINCTNRLNLRSVAKMPYPRMPPKRWHAV